MQGFLDGAFASLFDEAGWTTDWSNAASQPLRSRISPTQLIDASVHANEQALRELAQAYTMVLDAGVGTLGESAARTVLTSATALLGQAMGHLTQLQSTIGVAQERVANASTQMSAQVDILAKLQADLEGVDPYEAATRVNTLTTQLETSYALTARMHQLSLLNYL
jgi:flagellar hook-associated protein 3 FlgL